MPPLSGLLATDFSLPTLSAGLLLVATPWLIAWYAVWAVPLAAVEEDRAARLLALGLSAYLLRNAVPL